MITSYFILLLFKKNCVSLHIILFFEKFKVYMELTVNFLIEKYEKLFILPELIKGPYDICRENPKTNTWKKRGLAPVIFVYDWLFASKICARIVFAWCMSGNISFMSIFCPPWWIQEIGIPKRKNAIIRLRWRFYQITTGKYARTIFKLVTSDNINPLHEKCRVVNFKFECRTRREESSKWVNYPFELDSSTQTSLFQSTKPMNCRIYLNLVQLTEQFLKCRLEWRKKRNRWVL